MKKISFLTLFTFLIFSQGIAQEFAENRLLIQFNKSTTVEFDKREMLFQSEAINALNKKHNLIKIEEIGPQSKDPAFTFYALVFSEKQNIAKLIEEYMATQVLEYAEPDYILKSFGNKTAKTTPNDQMFWRSWGLENTGQAFIPGAIAGNDVDMTLAWDLETGDTAVVLSTMDTGLKTDHPEFAGRLWVNTGEIPNNNIDDDNNGYVDDINGYNTSYNNEDVGDDQGHGTNVTGISAATGNNGIGYAGADWFCKVMTVKCLDSNSSGLNSRITQGIYYSVDNGAHVINMSLGGTGFSSSMNNAVVHANQNNTLVVAAMGNSNNSTTNYPAGYNFVLAVGSTDADGERTAPFSWGGGSSFGNHISVCAPGNYIYGLHNESNTNYNEFWSGTSQATPLVSGIATLVIANYQWLTPADIKSLLENSAEDQVGKPSEDVPGFDIYHGHGRVNAYQALMSIGIEEDYLLSGLKVYPNPASDVIKLEWQNEESIQVKLTDGMGRTLKSLTVNSGLNTMQIGDLAAGIYFIQLNEKAVKKVLISR